VNAEDQGVVEGVRTSADSVLAQSGRLCHWSGSRMISGGICIAR